MLRHAVTIFTSLLLLGPALYELAHARITRIDIDKIELPTFDGASFGNSGPYEKLTGKAHGELGPAHELNRNVVLLDKAPRNAAGRVEYSVDIMILKPVDMSRGNGTLIYDSVNRGNLRAIQVFNLPSVPTGKPDNPAGRVVVWQVPRRQERSRERRRCVLPGRILAGLHLRPGVRRARSCGDGHGLCLHTRSGFVPAARALGCESAATGRRYSPDSLGDRLRPLAKRPLHQGFRLPGI